MQVDPRDAGSPDLGLGPSLNLWKCGRGRSGREDGPGDLQVPPYEPIDEVMRPVARHYGLLGEEVFRKHRYGQWKSKSMHRLP